MNKDRSVIRCLAFDLGGVLVDVNRSTLTSLNLPRARLTEAFFGEESHTGFSLGHVSEANYFRRASEKLSGTTPAQLQKTWGAIVEWRSYAFPLLRRIAVPVVFWSNTDPTHIRKLMAVLDPSLLLLEKSIFSFAVGQLKPDEAFYELGLSSLGLSPAEVLFLDDRPENIAAAAGLGICARQVTGENDINAVLREFSVPLKP